MKQHNFTFLSRSFGWRSAMLAFFVLLGKTGLAQSLLTESFNYPSTTLLTNANWVLRASGTPAISVGSGNLNYAGSIANTFGNKVSLSNTGQDVYRSFTGVTSTTYASMVLSVSAAQATGDYFFALGNATSPLTYGGRIYIRSNGAGFSFGVQRSDGTVPVYESTVRSFNTNYFVVLKYEVVAGTTNDPVKLYVNPFPISIEPTVPDVVYNSIVAGTDIGGTTLSSVNLYQGTAANAPTLDIDGIQVSTTWAGVSTAQYDYGDAPLAYEQTKDNVFAPAVHAPVTGFYLGSLIGDVELAPNSVAAATDNNTPNGDGADEDALAVPVTSVRKGTAYSIQVPVTNPVATTKYLYAWIDFNDNGRFELGELTTATLSFTTTGTNLRTLTWTAAQTAAIPDGVQKLYMRLRLSDAALADFTTAASGGATLDERSLGNGAISTANAMDAAVVTGGEVEDYQVDVIRTYDFGDVPFTFENDKDGVARPALHGLSSGLSIGSLVDVESAPFSVTSPLANNDEGDNEDQFADEDGLIDLESISRGVAYTLSVPVNSPTGSGTKYVYAWLDLNGDGRFQVGEVATTTTATVGPATVSLTWANTSTATITAGTKTIYLRIRLSNSPLNDFTGAAGGTTIDERSIGNGAVSTADATNAAAVALGEVEDYQLRVDDYDFGDAPLVYENGLPARQIALPTRKIGSVIDNEASAANVAAAQDNNNDNGDGADEDGLTDPLPVITKGALFSFSVPMTVSVASNAIAWIDFNNDGKFQLSEAAYTAATGATTGYQTVAVGTTTKTFWFRGSQTNQIPTTVSNVYVRIRLMQTQGTDAAGTTAVDERSIGDGLSTGVYGTPSIGEIEDYRFAVATDMDYGDAPVTYDQDKDGSSAPARNYTTDQLYLGQSYVLESGPVPVAPGADNNGANGDGVEEDGLAANQLFIRTNAINAFTVAVNNTTGAAATLHAWIDLNNNGRFESGEYQTAAVANNATSATISFSVANVNTIPSTANKVYMRLRLVQANAEITIADLTSGANNAMVDERAISDGLSTGVYTSASMGEVEDYQLTIIKDFGDAPLTYENGDPASHSNAAPVAELTIGAAVDFELANQAVAAGADNNGTNGDGADEDGLTTPQTVTISAPFTLTVPINTAVTGTKYLYGWIDFNGDGIFNNNEAATASLSITAGTTGYITLTWTGTQTANATAVLSAGKTYARLRLSGSTMGNGTGAATAIDSRSFGRNTDEGEVEDYQFLVSNLYDYGDAPLSYEANAATLTTAARQAPSTTLRLGATVDAESGAQSVAAGANNNGLNGDGIDEDGVAVLAPVYSNTIYRTQVSILNNSGAARTLYGWIDFNNDGRFAVGEVATVSVPTLATMQTVTLSWPATATTASQVYMRLRVSDGTLTDLAGTTAFDERSIGDGLSTGLLGTLNAGEVEDYVLPVGTTYDYGDAGLAIYDQSRLNVLAPARQAISQGLYLGQILPDAEAAKQVSGTTASGDDATGVDDEDGAVPGPVTPGGGYTLNVTVTNNSGAARTLYGWIDFNNNGRFEAANEMASVSVANNTYNGVVTLSWTTTASATIPGTGLDSLYMRLRISEGTLTDAADITLDERALADGLNTGEYAASNPVIGNGEIEDYRIKVTTDLDYGDVPVSYEQPAGVLRPARQISSAALQIGGTPDVELTASSVAAGADNNGTNGDGADEDGIIPANNPVTVNAAFTLPVTVTNTTGTGRILYGWLDLNNNGIFEDNEVATTIPTVNTGANNSTVNLVWPAASTIAIQSPKVYLRLRLSDAALTNNTATTYDERAFADGFTTGVYAAAANRGEIEDYQLSVIPTMDFGDVPLSFENNNAGIAVPARHLPAATLYLGSSYDVEQTTNAVTAAADNNGANGDGADENGIASLPTLNSGGSYAVPVSVFKSVAGTGTIHAWIDMNGDGRFSASEYTSVAVTAATGAQTVNLAWAAVPYSGSNNYTYMRLRFTTGAVTDNTTTLLVDERSIGDGLSTGLYGTSPVNGEVEDYRLNINNAGTPTPAVCTGLGAIDPIQAAFHATMVRPASGGYLIFGEQANGDGVNILGTPTKLEAGANGFTFTGNVLMATLASSMAYNYQQYFVLTTSGLYAWGTRGVVVNTAVTSGTAVQAISMPPGITPAMVKMIDAGASYLSNGTVGDQTGICGSLAILTTTGEVWIRSSVSASAGSDFNAVQGDGDLAANNGSTDWHQVQTAAGVPLTGMLDVRSTGAAAVATNGSVFYTWGRNVYVGDGSALSTKHFATPMTIPPGFAAPASKVDLGYGSNVSASYYVLDNAGVVHVLGNNNVGQLGIGSTTATASWTRITQKNEEPAAAGNQPDVTSSIGVVTTLSSNNHDANFGSLIIVTADKRAYHAGSNAGGGGMSGTVSPTSFYIPTAMTTAGGTIMLPGKVVYAESGGHIGVLAKEGSDRYGYVGHTVSGSDGCNSCTANPSEYDFSKTTSTGPLCGIVAYDFGDLDNRYNLGDKARHEIKYAQASNPLKLGTIAADSDDEPQVTGSGNTNAADGDDVDEKGDDEDAFTGTLPLKTAGQPYTLSVPLTNNTGAVAYLYGFIDWNGDGILTASEAVVATVNPATGQQNVVLNWADPGNAGANCLSSVNPRRSFVRLRLTSSVLTDSVSTTVDDRSYIGAADGEVEDYFVDWMPPTQSFDYGNLPTVDAPVTWPAASAVMKAVDLSTTRVWLGDNNSYPNQACASNEDRNGGLMLTQGGTPVSGSGTAASPFVFNTASSTSRFNVTVNGNGASGTPVYWGLWFDANKNGVFTDADDIFVTGTTAHGSPVTVSIPFAFSSAGTNAGATGGAIRLVATAVNTTFTKAQNGMTSVEDGEVEDYYLSYVNLPLPVSLLQFTATKQGSTVALKWTTLSEQNNKGFDVERSSDGQEWTKLGFVSSKAPNGNSSAKLEYSFNDEAPLDGKNLYRLKQLDLNGAYVYSEVRLVIFNDNISLITLTPNPMEDELNVQNLEGNCTITIINAAGSVMQELNTDGSKEYRINTATFTPGVYFVNIRDKSGKLSRYKVVKY